MCTVEQDQSICTEKKYTELDLLAVFRHGMEYEYLDTDGDIATEDLPEKNHPFWGWLRLKQF